MHKDVDVLQLLENFEKVKRQRTQIVRIEKREMQAVTVHALNDPLHCLQQPGPVSPRQVP